MKAGLRLDQGPPFAIPLLFFFSAPLFLSAAGAYAALAWDGWTTSRWNFHTLALTHLVALGYLGMAMLGALTQMAPVAAGAPLPRVAATSRLSHALLLVGTPLLAWGLAGGASALLPGALFCALGLLGVALIGLIGLARAPSGATPWAMRLALAALIGLVALGLGLAAWLAGYWTPGSVENLIDGHAALGLIGWVGLLVIGSAYQVVPMLQLTPNYPTWTTRHLASVIAGLLLAWLTLDFINAPETLARALFMALTASLAGFALITLHLQRRRRRKVGDTTLSYWRVGMLSLLAAGVVATGASSAPAPLSERLQVLAGILFLLGFAASVVNGMLLKIIPFLAWFHLQTQVGPRQTGLSGMKDFYPDTAARRQFLTHLAALAFLLPSPWLPGSAIPGGTLLAVSGLLMVRRFWLGVCLFRALGGRLRPA